ncbi:MAG TPA: hypothetical protein VMY42_28070 [Thermoguttaceae bacterium]|nr:hypothetical protein [Thermoguttaceae bacterium]
MSQEQRRIPVYVDFTPNYAAHPETKETTASFHRQWLETNLDAIIDRQSQLPIMMIHHDGPAVKLVVDLLLEARQLFCLGYHYSCVAMCGIVVERIIKDILRHNLLVARNNEVGSPSHKAFDQIERVDVRSLINFVAESGLISNDVKAAAVKLGDLRNQYAHARGQSPDADALKAIEHLHTVVGGTVSVLKEFEIKDGVLVRRPKE